MNTGKRQRFQFIDVTREFAVVLMVIYHFSYDLSYFGLASFNFYEDRFWLSARTFILSLFLLLVGVSLVMATRDGINWRTYWRRFSVLVLCAALISIATYYMFAERMIFFGVLHFILVASVLALPFVQLCWLNAIIGMMVVLLGAFYGDAFFNQPAFQWIGLMTYKPPTEDYVPLFPWFGAVLFGLFLGRKLYTSQALRLVLSREFRNPLVLLLALFGRNSLLIYMVHQPLFLGCLWLITR